MSIFILSIIVVVKKSVWKIVIVSRDVSEERKNLLVASGETTLLDSHSSSSRPVRFSRAIVALSTLLECRVEPYRDEASILNGTCSGSQEI